MIDANQKQTKAQIRKFRADGTLTAHRTEDGNYHIVEANGRDPHSTFERTVPATRTAVVEGESLWTIPDNWERKVETERKIMLHIPETGVDVAISNPRKCPISEADYVVKHVGELQTNIVSDVTDRDAMDSLLEEIEQDEDRIPAPLPENVRALDDNWTEFVAEYTARAEKAGVSHWDYYEDESGDQPIETGEQTYGPGESHNSFGLFQHVNAAEVLRNLLEINSDAAASLSDALVETGAITVNPEYAVNVESFGSSDSLRVPTGYRVTALTEAGCSPAEAVDYLMTDIHGMTQTEWAGVRGKDPSTVSENVNSARRTL